MHIARCAEYICIASLTRFLVEIPQSPLLWLFVQPPDEEKVSLGSEPNVLKEFVRFPTTSEHPLAEVLLRFRVLRKEFLYVHILYGNRQKS